MGLCYSLFEGAMYVFVFNWVPTLAAASGGFGAFAPVQGLLFSCLMAAISIGGELYNYAFGAAPVEGIGVAIYASASVCMTIRPIPCLRYSCLTKTRVITPQPPVNAIRPVATR